MRSVASFNEYPSQPDTVRLWYMLF